MMSNVVCIIQARRGSSRLPDKVLLPLGGKAVLAHVIERCRAIKSVDEVICATVDDPYEDVLAQAAATAGATVFRGSESDVLDRYYQAALIAGADYVMRVTSDCPLIDPEVCDDLVTKVVESGADYGGNGAFPHGLDCEVFTMALLAEAHRNATSKEDREHVTLWMKRNKAIKKAHITPDTSEDYSQYRWTLDYPEDYEFFKALHQCCENGLEALSYKEIVSLLIKNEALCEINSAKIEEWSKATAKILDKSKG